MLTQSLTLIVIAALVLGAVYDATTSRIPNRLVLVGLIVALAGAGMAGGIPGVAMAAVAAAIALAIGFGGFAIGAFGGGDAKFLMVGGAFVGLSQMVPYLLATALLGGALALGAIVWRRKGIEATVMTMGLAKKMVTLGRKGYRGRLGDEGRLAVPYGVAIAAAALLVQFTSFSEWILG
jgi:prepilin peptidase CpaA